MSKLIEDAIFSPIGSTKRKRAQQILSVVRKTGRLDGAGGPGPGLRIPQQDMHLAPQVIDYSNFVVFPSTPKIKIPIGTKKPVLDGAGGGSTFIPSPSSLSTRQPFGGGGGGSWDTNSVSGPLTSPLASVGPTSNFWNPPYSPAYQTPNRNMSLAADASGLNMTTPAQNFSSMASTQPTTGTQPSPTAGTGLTQPPVGTQTPSVSSPQTPPTPTVSSGTPSGTSAGQTPSTGFSVQKAVDSNMGPSMFAYQALAQGSKYLKNVPGFENLPEATLNQAPTFAGRMAEVEKATRSTYRLDELLGQYQSAIQEGAGLQTTLTDYIRGRDEFLNETDSLIGKFKNDMTNLGTSDPSTVARYNQYGNYLYELRGRQNKRYIEFLNAGINEYSGRLTAMDNLYKTALDGYSRELTSKQAITQEEYNLMFGALSDMYTTTQNAPMVAAQMAQMQAQTYAAQVSATKDALAIKNLGAPDVIQTVKDWKSIGVLDEFGRYQPNAYLADISSANAASAFPVLMDSLDKTFSDVKTYKADGTEVIIPAPSGSEATKVAKSIIDQLYTWGAQGALNQSQIQAAEGTIASKLSGAIFGNYMNPEHETMATSAIDELANVGSGWLFKNKMPSRTDFINNYAGGVSGNGLSADVLNTIYTDFQDFKDNPKAFKDLYTKSSTDQSLSGSGVIRNIANSYVDKLFTTPTQ